jgi:TonB family protein
MNKVLLSLILVTCITCTAISQTKSIIVDTVNVKGNIYGNDGEPASSIIITALQRPLNVHGSVYYAKTDSTGRFELKGLRVNDTLTIENSQYYSQYAVAGARFVAIRLPLKKHFNIGTMELCAPRRHPKLPIEFNIEEDNRHVMVNTLPEFVGGNQNFIKFIKSKLSYPEKAVRSNIEGAVEIAFEITRDGSLNNIRLLKGIGYGCDEEALRIVSHSPKWRPGRLAGRPEETTQTVTIQFKLTDK